MNDFLSSLLFVGVLQDSSVLSPHSEESALKSFMAGEASMALATILEKPAHSPFWAWLVTSPNTKSVKESYEASRLICLFEAIYLFDLKEEWGDTFSESLNDTSSSAISPQIRSLLMVLDLSLSIAD